MYNHDYEKALAVKCVTRFFLFLFFFLLCVLIRAICIL